MRTVSAQSTLRVLQREDASAAIHATRGWLWRVGLVLVVAVGAALRFWRLDLAEYKYDEAGWLRLGEDIARFGQLPLAGMRSSQGIQAPPHFAYLLAPIVLVSRDPLVASGAIAFVNVLGLVGAAWMAWRAFGRIAAVTAVALLACNPWSVTFARKIWQPDILPALAVLLWIALDRALIARSRIWAAASFPIVALGAMVHLSFGLLAPLLLAPAYVLAREKRWLALATGCVAALLIMAPLGVYEQRTGWANIAQLRSAQAERGTTTNFDALGEVLGLATGWATPAIANVPITDSLVKAGLGFASVLETTLLACAVLLGATLVLRSVPGIGTDRRKRIWMVLGWLMLPIVLMLRHAIQLYPHYFLMVLPAPFLLIGAFAQWLAERSAVAGRLALGGVLSVTLLVIGVQASTTAAFIDHLQSTYEPCYGLPLRTTTEMAAALTDFGRRENVAAVSIENDEADAQAVGYLVRTSFPRVDLVKPDVPLAAGLSEPLPARPEVALATNGSVPQGVKVLAAWMPQAIQPDWRVHLALAWQDAEAALSGTAVHWRVQLGEGNSAIAETGIEHMPADLAGRPQVSWFTLEVPPEVGRARLPLTVQLLDTSSAQVPFQVNGAPDGPGWQVAMVDVGSSPRCAVNPP